MIVDAQQARWDRIEPDIGDEACERTRCDASMVVPTLIASLAAQAGSKLTSAANPLRPEPLPFLQRALSALVVVSIELLVVVIVCAALYGLTLFLLRTVPARLGRPEWGRVARVKARNILLVVVLGIATGVVAYNGWLLARGVDVRVHTTAVIQSVTVSTWRLFGIALAELALASVVFLIVTRLLRGGLRFLERRVNGWDQLKDNNGSLARFFNGLDRAIVVLSWMLLAVLACELFAVPQPITGALLVVVRIYLIVVLGVMVIRSTAVIVDTLDGLSQRYARKRDWLRHYENLRPLLPTFRACLEYALWIAVGSLILVQLPPTQNLALWGPRLIQAIGIFFAGRVIIELGRLEIGHRMLPKEGLEETERRRRATMVPLVRSAFTYAVYFGTAVLVLGSLGFNPMPFLAGAGLLGLVIGFGAQSLINDVVSGFFILFENIYLVGDMVEVGPARGIVEAIEFRTTKIRDAEGRVHIIRNGDMKPVINYSKDYSVAMVAVEVPYDADMQAVFADLRQAGIRLRSESPDVLADLEIDGITAFGGSAMTVRTSTRVRAGRHEATAAALRLLIKETFDRRAAGGSRKALIADTRERRESTRAAAHR
jgi:small-conductance mechanosensitive channel